VVEFLEFEIQDALLWRLSDAQKRHGSVTLSGYAFWTTNSQVLQLCSQVIHRLLIVTDAVHGG
jgi:hypothetical protein